MSIMSLRGALAATKQSPVSRGDCFAKCARKDMWVEGNALPAHAFGRLLSAGEEEL